VPQKQLALVDAKEEHYWLALKTIPKLSVQEKLKLVEQFGLLQLFSDTEILSTLPLTASQQSAFLSPDLVSIDNIIHLTKSSGAQLLCYSDNNYPQCLKEIADPPLVLFCKGDISLLASPQLAVVGSRNATIGGREAASNFVRQIANEGMTITSGLALGIDAAAHRAALSVNGATIGVIAQGIDIAYPKRHKTLYQDIVDSGGLLITEFAPGTAPKAGHFPRRNRIISGLSLGVLVVEAEVKSGSLVTAKLALEQNREVFAIPGSINNPMASGCHWLIKQGAKLVENVADILSELNNYSDNIGLNYKREKKKALDTKKSGDSHLLIDPLLASVDYETTPVDKVVSRSKLPIEEVLTRLTVLELRGLVTAVPGGYLKLNGG